MFFFGGKKQIRTSSSVLLRPRRSRVFRGRTREDAENSEEKRRSLWTLWYGLLWTALLGGFLYGTIFSSLLRLDRIEVSGMKEISESDVESEAKRFLSGKSFGIFPNDTLPSAFVRRHSLERGLRERFPVFRTIRVSTVFPDVLTVSVEERKRMCMLCSGGPCFWVDERGVPFEGATLSSSEMGRNSLTVIDRSAKPIDLEVPAVSELFVQESILFRERLSRELGIATDMTAETPFRLSNELRLKTKENWELRVSAEISADKSLRALRLLLEKTLSSDDRKRLEYIDLRTENTVFYLLKGEEEKGSGDISKETKEDTKKKKGKNDE